MRLKRSKVDFTYLVLIISFFAILFVLARLQLVRGDDFFTQSSSLIVNSSKINGKRGLIYDRNGNLLVANKEVFFLKILATEENKKILNDLTLPFSDSETILEVKNISDSTLLRVQELVESSEIIDIEKNYSRNYLYPAALVNILGYSSLDDNNKFSGKAGVEMAYDEYLKPNEGVEVNNFDIDSSLDSISGNDLYLTIDLHLQNKLYEILSKYNDLLGGAGASAVVKDTTNGEILAMVSFPGYDVNQFVDGVSREYYDALVVDRNKPLLDKSYVSAFTPGSIFKIISATSLLNNQIIDEYSTFFSNRCIHLGDYPFCEFGQNFYGTVDVKKSLVKSSNLFYCNYLLMQEEAGILNKFFEVGNLYGIGKAPSLDIQGATSGNFSYDTYVSKTEAGQWFEGETCNIAIGQGETTVSPLQMADQLSTLFNNGFKGNSFVVKEVRDSNNEIVYKNNYVKEKVLDISDKNKNLILDGMAGVAYDQESATYYFLHDNENNLRVKTGSAETVENINGEFVERTHGWIVGLYDYRGKTYSFAFFVQYGVGGYYVTPMVKEYMDFINNL